MAHVKEGKRERASWLTGEADSDLLCRECRLS